MIRTLLHYRNLDSTLDLNNQLSEFFKRGIVSGGLLVPVPSQLSIDVTPFKLIGIDGMVVVETTDTVRLNVQANATNVVVFKSQYVPNDNPLTGFEVLELSVYNARSDIAYLSVFGFITLPALATQVVSSQISYTSRDVIDAVGRLVNRGTLTSVSLLPATDNRPGDFYMITSGLSDVPAIYAWNGSAFLNITDSVTVSSLLNAHRNNLFSNEIHLTDAQADAAQGSDGVPSASNRYVTESDPRLPTQNENDALVGLGGTPNASNPYVTGSYAIAQPTSKAFPINPGSALTITPGEGPVYVGLGGAGTPLKYFKLYHLTAPREYLNFTGVAIPIIGIFKDLALTQPLIPTSEPTVLADNGFYTGAVYLQLSGVVDLASRLFYGQKEPLSLIDRGVLLRPQPTDAETSQETLVRLENSSGRLFDDPIPTDEKNTELRLSINDLRKYLNATTAADLVVDTSEFPRLRKVSEFASDFPLETGETVAVASGTTFTVAITTAAINIFDPSIVSPDTGVVAIINYNSLVNLFGVFPGYIFVDGNGTRFRILAVKNAGNGSLMVWTAGQSVSSTPISALSGAVFQGNNPRQLEIINHDTSMYRDFVPVEGVDPDIDHFEDLPPGGNTIGSGAVFSLIGTPLLPNQGNSSGAPSGRPLFKVFPKKQGNRYESRISLVGNWKNDQENFPRQAVGHVSQGACGIEVTGRFTDLTLFTSIRPTMPFGFRVFVNGVYSSSASQFIADATLGGLVASNVISAFRTASEVSLQPIMFPLGLSTGQINTVRIEITSEGTDVFPLFGMEIFNSAGRFEAKGRAFTEADLVKTDLTTATSGPLPAATLKGTRFTRYINRATGVLSTVQRDALTVVNNAATVPMAVVTFNDPVIAASTQVGDILLLTDRTSPLQVTFNTAFKRVIAINRSTSDITIESSNSFSSTRVEMVYRVPSKISDGSPVVSAPESDDEIEYLRLVPSDWKAGSNHDISDLSADSGEDRVTVLDDGQTSLLVKQCQLVSTGLEGYSTGIRLNQVSSVMVCQGWGTRMDFVFTGNAGAVTLAVEIDGQYSYTLPLRGDGLERHSMFFKGAPQSHTVKISNPSLALRVIVSAWIFHDIRPQEFSGTALSEFVATRNSTANPGAFFDYASPLLNNALVSSFAGVRVVDITKAHSRFYNGTGVGFNWRVVQDFDKNPRFGYYVETNRNQGIIEIDAVGSHFEIYVELGTDKGKAFVLINDVVANTTNYPGLVANPTGSPFNVLTGEVNYYASLLPGPSPRQSRIVLSGLPFGRYKIAVQSNGTKDAGSSDFTINAFAFAENPGSGIVQKRNLDDIASNRLHFSSFQDLRQFVTLLPEQVGLVSGSGESTTTTSGIQQIPEALSGLIDLRTEPYFFGIYNDWAMDSAAISSPESPSDTSAGFSPSSLYIGSPPSVQMAYDATLSYTSSGAVVTLAGIGPSWASNTSDLVGAMFQPLGTSNPNIAVRISTASSLTSFTLERSITAVGVAESCAVKQCLHTKELIQFKPGLSGDNQSIADRLPLPLPSEIQNLISKDVQSILVDAESSTATGSAGKDPVYGTALISYTANRKGVRGDGTTATSADINFWSSVQTLPKYQEQSLPVLIPPGGTDNERLFLRFFPAQVTGTGTVNLLRWAALCFEDRGITENSFVLTPFAWGYTNNATASVNCTISVVSGKTRIAFTQPYNFNAFPNTTDSILEVFIDGKKFPRATSGVTITTGYFTEIDSFHIDLNTDYSASHFSVDVRFKQRFSQINVGTFSPLNWVSSGFIVVSGDPFDGARGIFEPRTFTRLRLSALDTGVSGITTVEIYQNGALVGSGTLTATGTNGSELNPVLISATPDDIITAKLSTVGVNTKDLSVELA